MYVHILLEITSIEMIQSVEEVNPLIILQVLRLEEYDVYNEINPFLLLCTKDEGRTFLLKRRKTSTKLQGVISNKVVFFIVAVRTSSTIHFSSVERLLDALFYSEGGGSTFLRNVGKHLPDYLVSNAKR
jgi:hypothetical protein